MCTIKAVTLTENKNIYQVTKLYMNLVSYYSKICLEWTPQIKWSEIK